MTSTTAKCRPVVDPDGTKEVRSSDLSLAENRPVRLAPALVEELTQPAVRSVQESITIAQPWYWIRRAEDLENARPKYGDFHGQATREDLAERYARLTEQADAARLHSKFLRRYPSPIGEGRARRRHNRRG